MIAWFLEDKKEIKDKVKNLEKESLELLDMIKQEVEYYNVYYELYTKLREGSSLNTPAKKAALKQRYPESLFAEEKLPRSKHGQRRFYLCKAFYYRLLGDLKKAHAAFLQTEKWWQENHLIKQEDSFGFVSDLLNVIRSHMINEEFEVVEKKLKQLDKLEKENKNPHLDRFIFDNIMYTRQVYYMNLENYPKALKLVPKIEKGLAKYADDISNYLALIYNVAVAFFLDGDYKGCMNWSPQITALRGEGFFIHLRKSIRLLQICSCFELDNDEFPFLSNWRTINTYFKRMGARENVDFELKTMAFMKEMYQSTAFDKTANAFQQFLKSQMKSPPPSGCQELSIWLSKYSTI